MSQKKILVIDDSATIRRLADSILSPAGYQVVLAPDAEEGIKQAQSFGPDLILLDHQLPGTTGYDVACQLLEIEQVRCTPVVISSTLRKKAYVEYADLANVVDMLPKPYTPDLMLTTVSNALDTGKMIVESQSQGTAVPEVIDEVGEATLRGTLGASFTIREVLDFLNNGGKSGVLELEGQTTRSCFYLDKGHIQGTSVAGLDPVELVKRLPASLESLGPVIKLTLGGRGSSELEGLVELLDRRVVDPRLLRKLLRFQAAQLLVRGFQGDLKEFRFDAERPAPSIVEKLPLDISTLGLLIDGALSMDDDELPSWTNNQLFARKNARGHNLDRAGVGPQHIKLLGALKQTHSLQELSKRSGCNESEVRRVMYGLMLADLAEPQSGGDSLSLVAFGLEPAAAKQLDQMIAKCGDQFSFQCVRDNLTLKLVLRRSQPFAVLLNLANDEAVRTVAALRRHKPSPLENTKLVGLAPTPRFQPPEEWRLDAVITGQIELRQLQSTLQQLASGAPANDARKAAAAVAGAVSED